MEARWIVLAVVVVVAAVGIWIMVRNERRKQLRDRFGPEYDHAVRKYGNVTRAESDLAARQERVSRFEIKPLRAAEAERFAAAWRRTQSRFVDEPRQSIAEADRLVQEVMEVRGYPVGDFEQRVADVSVDHPVVVEHYRAAHRIALANADSQAGTEDLRQAMVHYRALFEDLLEVRDEGPRRMEAGR
jgi:hypothetical protein